MKKLIITIDTEGDNLWAWKSGQQIGTENTLFLERFQKLSNEYGFYPTWLTNWEMVNDDRYVTLMSKYAQDSKCEIGMHLHAWNMPPEYKLDSHELSGNPYLIEYPTEIMEEKIALMTDTIRDRFGITPTGHRAGRWAMNDEYFTLLAKYGYKADCSHTPGIDWSECVGQTPDFAGPDYRNVPRVPTVINGILEVPVTTIHSNRYIRCDGNDIKSLLRPFKRMINGETLWLRPDGENIYRMLYLMKENMKSDSDYLMFMIHSSELMPGGSPTFRTEESIEKLYKDLEVLFGTLAKNYEGITLSGYADMR